jgi:hypothetical protein
MRSTPRISSTNSARNPARPQRDADGNATPFFVENVVEENYSDYRFVKLKGLSFTMAGADRLKQDIRDIVHEVVDPRFDKMDAQFTKMASQLQTIIAGLPSAPPSGPGSAKGTPKP